MQARSKDTQKGYVLNLGMLGTNESLDIHTFQTALHNSIEEDEHVFKHLIGGPGGVSPLHPMLGTYTPHAKVNAEGKLEVTKTPYPFTKLVELAKRAGGLLRGRGTKMHLKKVLLL